MNRIPATAHAMNRKQYAAFKRLIRDSKDVVRDEAPTVEPANRSRLAIARLMTIGDEFPKYNPLETRKAAIFQLDRISLQATVKFYGEDLWGDVWLNIGSTTIRIDCRATTDELREALPNLRDCRITAFPGMWEFAFGDKVTELPEITCEAVLTTAPRRFLGGVVVTQEGWRSSSANGEDVSVVDVIDAIPYIEGELRLGAMAIGTRYGDEVYLAGQWSCPAFSFRSV
jgi:hypothetical protein